LKKNAKLSHNWAIFIKFSPAMVGSEAESSIRAIPVQLAQRSITSPPWAL